jgi:hypothetical protein
VIAPKSGWPVRGQMRTPDSDRDRAVASVADSQIPQFSAFIIPIP